MSTNRLGLLEAFDEHVEDFTESKKHRRSHSNMTWKNEAYTLVRVSSHIHKDGMNACVPLPTHTSVDLNSQDVC
jgi:hypothetical protein